MKKPEELIVLLEQISSEFHTILFNMEKANQPSDGIVKSISITLDKALYNSANNLPVTNDIKQGINNACIVAVKLFEGSGLDDDLERIRAHLFA